MRNEIYKKTILKVLLLKNFFYYWFEEVIEDLFIINLLFLIKFDYLNMKKKFKKMIKYL